MTTHIIVYHGQVMGIKCLICGRDSYHPTDVEERYCARCKVFHNDMWIPEKMIEIPYVPYLVDPDSQLIKKNRLYAIVGITIFLMVLHIWRTFYGI